MTDVDKMIEVMTEMREVIKEAHGVQKDLAKTIKEAKQLTNKWMDETVNEAFTMIVASKVEDLNISIAQTGKRVTKEIYDRFDLLSGILLGTDTKSIRDGKSSLYDLAKAYVEANGPVTDFRETGEGVIPDIEKRSNGRETGREGK